MREDSGPAVVTWGADGTPHPGKQGAQGEYEQVPSSTGLVFYVRRDRKMWTKMTIILTSASVGARASRPPGVHTEGCSAEERGCSPHPDPHTPASMPWRKDERGNARPSSRKDVCRGKGTNAGSVR